MHKAITHSIALITLVLSSTAVANDSVEVTLGKATDQVDVLRIAWRKSWTRTWLVSNVGELSGRHVVSVNHWQGRNDSLNALAYSPVFVYRFYNAPVSYVKFGVGAAWLSDTRIQTRDLSSYYQFEDQIGLGWQRGVHDLSLVYMHYSNAGFSKPNDGIDMVVLSYAWQI